MSCELSTPTRRLRRKTWLGFHVVEAPAGAFSQHDVTGLLAEELETEVDSAQKSVYLVTLPALKPGAAARGYVSPAAWSHAEVLRVFLSVFQQRQPEAEKGVELECVTVFRERHAAGQYHWHVALKASRSFRWHGYKRALHVEHGLATHWSSSHTGYWSAVRYGVMPSPQKPLEDLDVSPQSWAKAGPHPDLFEVAQEPVTAAALSRRREKKVKDAAATGKPEPRPTEMDLYAVIVKNGFKNTPDDANAAARLIAYLKVHGTPALVSFAFKNRAKLPALIDDVWSWEKVEDYLETHAKCRLDQLYAAASAACQCHGRWMPRALLSLSCNGVPAEAFCKDVFTLLRDGRRADVPVMVLMGRFGGEGKSFLLAPLRPMYGQAHIQATPQRGSFPLLGLESKKVALLDDWCFDESVIPLPTQLLWYEGKPFPLPRPQNSNQYSGHLLYEGSAPIFVTVKEKDLGPLQAQAQVAFTQGIPSEHTMLLRRLRIYRFTRPLPQADGHILDCPVCFAQMILRFAL
ncbi:SAM domain-containing protein (Fragment) [Durusdinium trenchii]|uniref:SAM domain-containing protein n=1 Tax=Durusdinium trenchii TaxID=1381693 RepID=A0ABP0MSN5_9DINO